MTAGEISNLRQHFARSNRSGWIIGIDQHNSACPWRDFFLEVVKIGLPSVFFVQVIGVESNFDLRQNCGIERIVGAGSEQVVARIEQPSQADVYRLADA